MTLNSYYKVIIMNQLEKGERFMKIAVIFGGMSTEHEVSIVSGTSVLKNLDKEKYEILPLYIGKDGTWYEYTKNVKDIDIVGIDEKITELKKIDNIIEVLRKQDLAFPVLHGLYRRGWNYTRII